MRLRAGFFIGNRGRPERLAKIRFHGDIAALHANNWVVRGIAEDVLDVATFEVDRCVRRHAGADVVVDAVGAGDVVNDALVPRHLDAR
eukprot:CAMPEP_0182800564 /NCGR_PEP_ID=MMETSP0006_2-20121128/2481_1 /TAXON_ID=97485 /ORGANISM="Prymnesium parvum, Strain Texoma1" /LENGTH=87 /DNA_ID=CAMNT_0024925817 /DNA_START=379 /DNA_END=640 /DNA_ORIENTATION=+